MARADVKCPFCQQIYPVKKHGLGIQVINAIAAKPVAEASNWIMNTTTKDKIIDLTMNNADIRDTARALHISINAVVRTLTDASNFFTD